MKLCLFVNFTPKLNGMNGAKVQHFAESLK